MYKVTNITARHPRFRRRVSIRVKDIEKDMMIKLPFAKSCLSDDEFVDALISKGVATEETDSKVWGKRVRVLVKKIQDEDFLKKISPTTEDLEKSNQETEENSTIDYKDKVEPEKDKKPESETDINTDVEVKDDTKIEAEKDEKIETEPETKPEESRKPKTGKDEKTETETKAKKSKKAEVEKDEKIEAEPETDTGKDQETAKEDISNQEIKEELLEKGWRAILDFKQKHGIKVTGWNKMDNEGRVDAMLEKLDR